jgi:MFS transporter, PAT family, beta-lactamase induction signal transducer AmpG
MDTGPSTSRKLALLSTLYFSQGLPYGFFVQALPVLMRQQGRSLEEVGLASLLMLPWGLKLVFAPVVDGHRGSRMGARRGWIVPLQWLTIGALMALAFASDARVPLGVMAAAVVITAAFAAMQDIATDGLAVSLLSDRERGLGNGIQVAAYRVGMVLGGGALLVVFNELGWFSTFGAMAALLLCATIPVLFFREPPMAAAGAALRVGAVVRSFFKRPGMGRWLLLLALFKVGDAIGSPMVKPLLVDMKMTTTQIAFISGTVGSAVALLGAIAGGVLASRVGRVSALLFGGLVHAALMAGYALASTEAHGLLSTMLVLEHFTGSMATVALFTVMMDASDPRTGATDYTVQASVVVWATALGSASSGFLATALGYGPFFVAAALVCAIGTWVLVRDVRAGRVPRVKESA